jgi:hypothetical protein
MLDTKTGKRNKNHPLRMMPRTYRARNIPSALAAMEKDLGNGALIVAVHKIQSGKSRKARRQSIVEIVAMPPAIKLQPDGPPFAKGKKETSCLTSFWNDTIS